MAPGSSYRRTSDVRRSRRSRSSSSAGKSGRSSTSLASPSAAAQARRRRAQRHARAVHAGADAEAGAEHLEGVGDVEGGRPAAPSSSIAAVRLARPVLPVSSWTQPAFTSTFICTSGRSRFSMTSTRRPLDSVNSWMRGSTTSGASPTVGRWCGPPAAAAVHAGRTRLRLWLRRRAASRHQRAEHAAASPPLLRHAHGHVLFGFHVHAHVPACRRASGLSSRSTAGTSLLPGTARSVRSRGTTLRTMRRSGSR
jgi:hypothetical protein